jgi:uncharacterized membrane protein YhaH (DUF805 family)
LLFIGTYLHPLGADPNDAQAAFAEYATNRLWIASHLTQLAGVALMATAILLLARRLEAAGDNGWAHLAAGAAIASLAVAAALQAVDGVALKRMVDTWAAAPASEKNAAFRAAFAVRQLEIGLASMVSLLLGATATLSGLALRADRAHPAWLGVIAVLGGIPTMVAGVVMAYTGFSEVEMWINMPANSLLLIWMLILGGFMWRRPEPR